MKRIKVEYLWEYSFEVQYESNSVLDKEIDEIKIKIKKHLGIPVKMQVLYLFDQNKKLKKVVAPLSSDSTVRVYINYKATQILFTKFLTWKSIQFNVHSYTTVEDLKVLLQDREGLPPDSQRMIHGGIQIEDDMAIENFAIDFDKEIQIMMLLRLRGGWDSLNWKEFQERVIRTINYNPTKAVVKSPCENENSEFSRISVSREFGPLRIIMSYCEGIDFICSLLFVSKDFFYTSKVMLNEGEIFFNRKERSVALGIRGGNEKCYLGEKLFNLCIFSLYSSIRRDIKMQCLSIENNKFSGWLERSMHHNFLKRATKLRYISGCKKLFIQKKDDFKKNQVLESLIPNILIPNIREEATRELFEMLIKGGYGNVRFEFKDIEFLRKSGMKMKEILLAGGTFNRIRHSDLPLLVVDLFEKQNNSDLLGNEIKDVMYHHFEMCEDSKTEICEMLKKIEIGKLGIYIMKKKYTEELRKKLMDLITKEYL